MDVTILDKKNYIDLFNSYFDDEMYQTTIILDGKGKILSNVCTSLHKSNFVHCLDKQDNMYFIYHTVFVGKNNIVGYTTYVDDSCKSNYDNSRYMIHLFTNRMSVIADFIETTKFTVSDDKSLRFVVKLTGESFIIFKKKKADILTNNFSITVTDTDDIYRIHSITEDVKRTIQCYLNNWDKDDRPDAGFNIRILDRDKNLYMLFLIHFTKGKKDGLFIQKNFDNGELINISKTDISTIETKFESWESIKSLDHAFRKIVFNIFEKRSKIHCPIGRSNLYHVIFYDVPMFLFDNYDTNKDEQEDSVYHIRVTDYDHTTSTDHIFIELGADGKYYLIIFRDDEDVYYHLWFSDYVYLVRNIETALDVKLFENIRGIGN